MSVSEVIESVQYLVDEDGQRTAAVIQIDLWQSLLDLLNSSDQITEQEGTDAKTPEEVIATIKARPANSENVIPPSGSLLEALQHPTHADEDFDLDEWTKQWQAVEQEMKTITRQNDLAEGRI
ncbi:MAG: hypothetical protein KDE19_05815 [Caldilineaceae bacterium]|nr:hypothetical protein [Caldilineaceae bacterium]